MTERSKLVRMRIVNIGCVGPEGLTLELDNIVCLFGPNNCGKSTVLHAYELALGASGFTPADLCNQADQAKAYVEMWVHIPQGTANIAEKWKTPEGDLLLVRSKWEWAEENGWRVIRQTWDPEEADYAADDKASGLDTVFTSRLPRPFRVGTLDDPKEEHKKLLTLIVQPVADSLRASLEDEQSVLYKSLAAFQEGAAAPVQTESEKLLGLKEELNKSHNAIFPDLKIDIELGIGKIEMDPGKLLLQNSYVKFREWEHEVDWCRQGTGSQRALFWTMLQVRSRLNAVADAAERVRKDIADGEKQIKKLEVDAQKAKTEQTKGKKEQELREVRARVNSLKAMTPEKLLEKQGSDVSLPGYMLLIDEPEIALHPNAIRAACGHLYGLAEDPAWQVMLTTHSPQFINPLNDHTTIVRLDRASTNPTPRMFRTASAGFSEPEKRILKMLNHFDTGLAEMFFGQYPVLVEGDTEFAVFSEIMNSDTKAFPLHNRPVIVRARGKYSLIPIVRMLRHFKVNFSILHDADWPSLRSGMRNPAWKANKDLLDEIENSRSEGLQVIHRVSVPTFELCHLRAEVDDNGRLVEPTSRDKPWNMVNAIREDPAVRKSVQTLFEELTTGSSSSLPFQGHGTILQAVQAWAGGHGLSDERFVAVDQAANPEEVVETEG